MINTPNKQLLAVIDFLIKTLFPVSECKQLWLLRNWVPNIDFTSYDFLAYDKRQLVGLQKHLLKLILKSIPKFPKVSKILKVKKNVLKSCLFVSSL